MLKKLSAFAALMFTLFFVPMMAFANEAEEAAVEASPTFITILAVLSFATLIYMIFLNVKDHN